MLARMRRKRICFSLLVGMQAGAATLENSMEVPQKTKNGTTLQPSNCTTRHLSKRYKCAVSKGHMHPHVYSSTIDNSKVWKEPKCPSMDEWIKKMWYIYICNGGLLGNHKEWNLATTWMELEGIVLSELVRERQKSYDFTHMRNLRHKTDEHKGRETKII